MNDSFMFFGTNLEYKELAKKENIKLEEPDKEKQQIRTTPAVNISTDDTSKINDEVLSLLKRTRHLHDATTVYMQSDISFYDTFYVQTDDTQIDDLELLQEARSIRRIYKSYPKYLYAKSIRDEYIEKVVDKIGSREMFTILLRSGGMQYWIPPEPIYSKKSEDYDDGVNGIIDLSILMEWNDDVIELIIDELNRSKGIENPSDVEIVGDIVTDNMTIVHSELVQNASLSNRINEKTSVNLADIKELQKIFRGWYQDDTNTESKTIAVDNSLENRAFSRTPEKIREAEINSRIYDFSNEFYNVLHGISNEPEYDPNEMVFDSVTQKPMTRREYDSRCLVRILKDSGWTETLKIMKLMNIGSSREHSILKRKSTKKKRSANKTVGTYTDIYGENYTVDDERRELFTDLDSLKAQMFID